MKANKIRFLAGGLAAVMIMSNMATMSVFAQENETPVETPVETVAEVAAEETPAVEETAVTDGRPTRGSAATVCGSPSRCRVSCRH